SSHCRTVRSTTPATLTSGGGGAPSPGEALELQAAAIAAASSTGSRRAARSPARGAERSMVFIVGASWRRGGGDGIEQRARRAQVAGGQELRAGGRVAASPGSCRP